MSALHVPDIAVAILRGGAVVADTVISLHAPALPQDARFEAASLAKPVFAAIVVSLSEQRRFDLDAPLEEYAGWSAINDARARKITARMVLSHTSGLPNEAAGAERPLVADPGTKWNYSGEGYRRLQRVIEQVTGHTLATVATNVVFEPLNMRHTTFADAPYPASNWAMGHDRSGRALPRHMFTRGSASTSLRTTAGDYARFLAPFVGSPLAPITAGVEATMWRPAAIVDSSLDLHWGLGWALQSAAFFHWGSNPGFKSFAFADRASHTGLVMLTDGDNGLELAPLLVRLITGREYSFFRFRLLHPTD